MHSRLLDPRRREFLQALAGATVLALPRAIWAQTGPSVARLGDRIRIITGAGNNVIALAGATGSLLVDSGDAAHARDLLQGTGRVSTVFNTHYHLESTGGNDAMAAAGASLPPVDSRW